MRRRPLMLSTLTLALVGVAALIPTGSVGSSAPAWQIFESNAYGISVQYPPGWHFLRRNLIPCTDPVQRLAISSSGDPRRGALVVLEERLDSDDGLPPRSSRFALRGKAEPLECCAPTDRAGYGIHFSDGGRGFYGYVYLGGRSTRSLVLRTLDSLLITSVQHPRPDNG